MEQREREEMHEGLDQALRAALQGLGSLRERKARSDQVKADQTRVAAAADRRQFDAYQQAQDAMLRGQLGNVTDDKWWNTTTLADIAATVDLAERYAGVSPYAHATLTNLRSEAERRGVDLTPPPRADAQTQASEGNSLDDLARDYDHVNRRFAEHQHEIQDPTAAAYRDTDNEFSRWCRTEVNRLETGITGQDGGRERLGAYLASTGEQRGWEEKLHPYIGADGRSTPASGQDGTAMWMKTAVAEIEKLPAADQAELGELMTRFDGQCRGSRALSRSYGSLDDGFPA